MLFKYRNLSNDLSYLTHVGTLLGWYRNCNVAPNTEEVDIDIAMNIEDYDDRIRNIFIGNNKLHLFLTISSVKSGFEMRLSDHLFNYDLFFLYKLNQTHRWSGYYVDKTFYKYVFFFYEILQVMRRVK